MKFQNTALALLATLSLGMVSTQASALSVFQTVGAFSSQAGASTIDFGATLPAALPAGSIGGVGYTFTGGALYNASIPSQTAKPAGAEDNFWSIGTWPTSQQGPGVVNFSQALSYLGFLWGSVDTYNTVSFYGGAGGNQLLGTYGGNAILPPANGSTSTYVNFTSGVGITKVVFATGNNAFETDNFAIAAIPEPETYAMLLAGLGLMGTIVRRRNKSKAV